LQTLDLRPGKPPESELDEARVTKVARVSARFSKSLARRQLRPNQEKVRSTTPRRGKMTKPFMSSLRLTISMRFAGINQPEEFRTLARAHVTAWRDDLASRALGGATVRLRLAAPSSLFADVCDKNAVTHNPVTGVKRPRTESGRRRQDAGSRRPPGARAGRGQGSRTSATAPSCRRCCITRGGARNCAS
jgi:hypothetical protein